MENWLSASLPVLIKVLITILIIFSVTIVITRISGLRTFAKMSSFDFASTIAIGSILASAILNTNQSILKAIVALSGIILFQFLFAFFNRKSDIFKKSATNSPLLLMKDGAIIYENIDKANVDISDLLAKLREANVMNFSEVSAVVFESTGDISVLHSNDKHRRLSDTLLEGVNM